jgi:hypothetical protein
MNAPCSPEKPEEPLKVESADADPHGQLTIMFNRPLTDVEVRMYRELPPAPTMLRDTKAYVERMQLSELVVSLFRTFVLGGVVIPETPRVMEWLKSWIDGAGHGPIGGPLLWPDGLGFVCELLLQRGFMRTPGEVGYVMRARKRGRTH